MSDTMYLYAATNLQMQQFPELTGENNKTLNIILFLIFLPYNLTLI